MARAVKEGTYRWTECINKGWVPYGGGSQENHIGGRLGEIMFAEFRKSDLDPDFSYAADKRRGCDLIDRDGIRWHIRSTRHRNGGLLIRPSDPHGNYALVVTSEAPKCWVIGWTTKQHAMDHVQLTGMRVDNNRKIYDCGQATLWPFPG